MEDGTFPNSSFAHVIPAIGSWDFWHYDGYGSLDLRRVHVIARDGRKFLTALRDRTRD